MSDDVLAFGEQDGERDPDKQDFEKLWGSGEPDQKLPGQELPQQVGEQELEPKTFIPKILAAFGEKDVAAPPDATTATGAVKYFTGRLEDDPDYRQSYGQARNQLQGQAQQVPTSKQGPPQGPRRVLGVRYSQERHGWVIEGTAGIDYTHAKRRTALGAAKAEAHQIARAGTLSAVLVHGLKGRRQALWLYPKHSGKYDGQVPKHSASEFEQDA